MSDIDRQSNNQMALNANESSVRVVKVSYVCNADSESRFKEIVDFLLRKQINGRKTVSQISIDADSKFS